MSDYDRLYDMLTFGPVRRWWAGPCNCQSCLKMRGTGVEPVSLSAPDPKSCAREEGTPRQSDEAPLDASQRQQTRAGLRPIVRHAAFEAAVVSRPRFPRERAR